MIKVLLDLFVEWRGQKSSTGKVLFNYLVVCMIVIWAFWACLGAIGYQMNFAFVDRFSQRIVDGFVLTLEISAMSLAISLLLGALVAAGKNSVILPVRYLCDLYVKIIRGTPLIMQIYLFFYIIGTAVGMTDRFWAGVFILSIFEGAYIAEIIRGSLLSIDATQRDAARAVGFNRAQTLRYVIVPQLVARTLPALTGQFASIVKDSSLLSLISVIELTQTMREISASNFQLFECYLLLGVLYLAITLPLEAIGRYFEKRFDFAH